MARAARVPRPLRGIEPGRVPPSSGLGPGGSDPSGSRASGLTTTSALTGPSPRRWGSATTRRAAWHRVQVRRALAAVLAGVATWLVVTALAPHPVETGVPVVVTTHDLAMGAQVGPGDVRLELRPPSQRPGSAVAGLADAVGRVTAGPVGSGELLTTTRFQGPSALVGLSPPRVAVSIPLVDDGLLPAVHAGDAVTVLAPGTGSTVATAAPVLSVSVPDGSGAALGSRGAGATVVVALTTQETTAVAAAMGGASGLSGFVLALGGR